MRDAKGVNFYSVDFLLLFVMYFMLYYLVMIGKKMSYFPWNWKSRYTTEGCKYLYEIDARINDMSRLMEGQDSYVIDSTNYGNVSRYINHRWVKHSKFYLMIEKLVITSIDEYIYTQMKTKFFELR